MLKKLRVSLAGALVLAAFSSSAHAALSPLGVSLIDKIEFPPADFSIAGARVSVIWGRHRNVYGFDIGAIGNITEHTFAGFGVAGIFNSTQGTTTALLQAAGIVNVNTAKTNIYGVQVAGILNSNQGETTVVGLQIAGLANYSPHAQIYGFQIGLYNKAHDVYGFQIGLINATEALHGIQIGLVNFNKKGPFEVSPIINVAF